MMTVVEKMLMQTWNQQYEDSGATGISYAAEGSATPECKRAES
jgi:hypothetical protein